MAINSKSALLLIDVQNDFHEGGSLAVPGARDDSNRLAKMIEENADKFGQMFVTLDSHHRTHIAHSASWNSKADGSGESPSPFTLITHDDVMNGRWFPTNPALQKHCEEYTKALEEKGRFKLCIWPDHCIIGTPGRDVVPQLKKALDHWEEKNPKSPVKYVSKGMNDLTEMYSAIAAEVPLPTDPQTHINYEFLAELKRAKKLYIAGQALSHCVNYTTCDIVENWAPRDPADIVLLIDGCSPVPSFEEDGRKFVESMRAAGVTLSTTTDEVIQEWQLDEAPTGLSINDSDVGINSLIKDDESVS